MLILATLGGKYEPIGSASSEYKNDLESAVFGTTFPCLHQPVDQPVFEYRHHRKDIIGSIVSCQESGREFESRLRHGRVYIFQNFLREKAHFSGVNLRCGYHHQKGTARPPSRLKY